MAVMDFRKTKIVCTAGPATDSFETLRALADAGMNVMRLNFSHGNASEHKARVKLLDEINSSRDEKIAVLLDTQGPEVRTGPVKDGGKVELKEGARVVLTNKFAQTLPEKIFVSYPQLPSKVFAGGRVLIADGTLELEVMETDGQEEVACKVVAGGLLGSNKNVGILGVDVDLPSLTDKDIELIKMGTSIGADYVAQSFVRKHEDIFELMELLQQFGSDAAIIAKVEHPHALANADQIIAASDGLMVARGDLGVQIPIEQVPHMQKMLVKKCNTAGKPVIVATQMLESMISNPRPTRAEATDVANAVYDGADAVMLSGETAAGSHPVKTVETMASILREAEKYLETRALEKPKGIQHYSIESAVDRASCQLARDLEVSAIITPTSRGFTSRSVSKNRPLTKIIALTPSVRVQRKLALVWGVTALNYATEVNRENMMMEAVRAVKNKGLVNSGETVIVTAGIPFGASGSTNTIRVQVVE